MKNQNSVPGLWYIVAALVLAIIAIVFGGSKTPMTPAAPSMTEHSVLNPRTYHMSSLQIAAAGDSEGDAVIQFYRDRVGYVAITGFKALAIDRGEAQTKSVMILVASREERRENGFPAETNWEYGHALRTIYAPLPGDYTELWTGVRLAHELSHAVWRLNGSVPQNATDLDLGLEEVRAHRFEARLLNRATQGQYLNTIQAWLDAQRVLPDAPRAWYTKPDEHLFQRLSHLFQPCKSVHEEATRRGSMLMTMNALLARKKGIGDRVMAESLHSKLFERK